MTAQLNDLCQRALIAWHARAMAGEAGEGVISAAIAVLVMAALGAVMWIGFQQIWGQASSATSRQVGTIGSGGAGATP